MKVAVFDTHRFERKSLEAANQNRHDLVFIDGPLVTKTAAAAEGCLAVCLFVNDDGSRETLSKLHGLGVRLIALRSAGYNHIDVKAATDLGMTVVRVPDYSPEAVAEHAVAMLLTLNRKTHRAYNRVREMNFSLDGLVDRPRHFTERKRRRIAPRTTHDGHPSHHRHKRPCNDDHRRHGHQHGTRRTHRLASTDRRSQERSPRRRLSRCLRGRGRGFFHRPFGYRGVRRRSCATADVSKRPHHVPPGFFDSRSFEQHRQYDDG